MSAEPFAKFGAPQQTFDVVVIGAGVIGCAVARRLAISGAHVAVVEKALDILDGASKGNSAILHTGFDAQPGTVEQACVAAGYDEYLEIHGKLGLPLVRSGALVVAWTEEEAAILPSLIAKAESNGVTDIVAFSAAQARTLEPGLGPDVRAAFRIPREYLIDPWSAPLAYLLQAVEHGATVMRGTEVTAGHYGGGCWNLITNNGTIQAKAVVNAAGLWGDIVDERLIGRRNFTIRPRKGQFIVYDKPASQLASNILLPVPNKVTKGIVVCRTVFGNLLVGPTAEEQEDRDTALLVPETLAMLQARGEQILPGLRDHEVTAIYAGLRPATEFSDYQIKAHPDCAYVTIGGIRSTGLSSALGTARHVADLLDGMGRNWTAPDRIFWPIVANISEAGPRDWAAAGHGEIVCHCELVTEREIEAALSGPLPAKTLGGLKRRTRVTMGRCQGFYCSAQLARLSQGRFTEEIAEPAHG